MWLNETERKTGKKSKHRLSESHMAKQNRKKDRNRKIVIDIHNHIKERQRSMKIIIKERHNRKINRNRRANVDNQYHMWLNKTETKTETVEQTYTFTIT